MATPEERISILEAEIAKDTARRDKAVVEGDGAKEERLDNLITESKKTLNILLQQQQLQAQTGGGQELGELQAMQMEVATQQLILLKNRIKRRPDNRGDSWIPTPESGYQSPAVLSVVGVGTAIHTESKADANDYELKERDYYIDLFKKHFNIEYNTSQGYFVVNNRKEFKIMLTAFGSTDVVHSNSGRNKEVKNDYMTLKLCDCQIDKFLVEIAKQGGKAKRDLWQQTTP